MKRIALCASTAAYGLVGGCGDDRQAPAAVADATDDAEAGAPDAAPADVDAQDADGGALDASDADQTLSIAPTVVANPANPLSVYVDWTTPTPANGGVEVVCGDDVRQTVLDGVQQTEHSFYVIGLIAESSCEARVVSASDSGEIYEGVAAFETGPLPEALPELALDVSDPEAVAPGWVLFNLTNQADEIPLHLVLVDEQGRYRWVHRRSGSYTGDATEIGRLEEGLIVGGNRTIQSAAIVTWDGREIWEAPFRQHHEIRPWPDENTFAFLGTDSACEPHSAHTFELFDRTLGEVTYRWSHCEHYQPVPSRRDWSHLNTIEPVPGENAVILSSRNESALFKVNLDTDQLEWILGNPPGPFEPEELTVMRLPDDNRFWEQHAPEVQDDGTILLFDNGSIGDREYSRVVVVDYDVEAATAEIVWSYRHEPDIFVPQWGDADRLDNGNVLSTWGARRPDNQSHIIEISPDGEAVWDLRPPPGWGIYRADKATDWPMGGAVQTEE